MEQAEREGTRAETRDGRGMCSGTKQGGTKKRGGKEESREGKEKKKSIEGSGEWRVESVECGVWNDMVV